MPVTLNLDVLVATRQTQSGTVYAFPVGARQWTARADDEETALELLREFLSKLLAKLPAHDLAKLVYPETAALRDIEAVLPRDDLPARMPVETSVVVPVITIPETKDLWAHVLPFVHTIHLPRPDAEQAVLRREIEAAAGMRKLGDEDYADVLPGIRHGLRRLAITTERQNVDDLTARAGARRQRLAQRERDEGIELLDAIGRNVLRRGYRDPVIGRDQDIRGLGALLEGSQRLSVALVGEPLVGKSALLHGLFSQRVVPFTTRPVFATSGAQLVAGQSGFGELQERIDAVMRAVERLDAVLYFDNFEDLFAGHSEGIEDLAAAMRPWVTAGRVRILGELTPEQWDHHEKRHVGFFAALHRVRVEPLDAEATRRVLRARLDADHRRRDMTPVLAPDAIEPIVALAERYLSYEAFPGKALRVYEELQAIHEGARADDGGRKILGRSDVELGFSQRTGIPWFLLRQEQALRLEEVERFFRRCVIGQHQAITRVAQTICTVKADLQAPHKPLATFLFVGPTGVGKTEIAKTLARYLFGSPERMIRFDMSEYMDRFAAERLIRGTERDEGELTRRVRQQPFCVVLLDEIEKASTAVFDLLLQVCGEGRLSDARGRTTVFHNAILIMTSNLGASHRAVVQPGFGVAADEPTLGLDERYYIEQVERHFRPEFVNRIDRIIPFHPLSASEIGDVARVTLERIGARAGLTNRNAALVVSEAALTVVAERGYSPRYGARALRRALEDGIVSPVAEALAALGPKVHGATVTVERTDEDGDRERTAASRTSNRTPDTWVAVRDDLRITVTLPIVDSPRELASGLEAIAHMRRLAAHCLAAPVIAAMRDRLAYLVADLARAGSANDPGNASGAAPAELQREHAILSAGLRGLDEPFAAIQTAEELAMVAQIEGDAAGLFRGEAELAFAAFERAYVQTLLGSSDRVTLLVRGVESPGATLTWLRPFLAGAAARKWDVTLHRHEDPDRAMQPQWPAGLSWGPPWSLESACDAMQQLVEGAPPTGWRTVLVGVRGPSAGALLRQEVGLHRYAAGNDGARHVEVVFKGDRATYPSAELETEAFSLPERLSPKDARRAPAIRVWREDGALELPGTPIEVDPRSGFDYWNDLERVLFGVLAGPAIAGQDFLED